MNNLIKIIAEIKQYENDGEFFRAYDKSIKALEEYPGNIDLSYRLVFNLANSKAVGLAKSEFYKRGLNQLNDIDFICLNARIFKDEGHSLEGLARRASLSKAIDLYSDAYELAVRLKADNAYYPCINIATLCLMLNRDEEAIKYAQLVLEICDEKADDFSYKDSDFSAYWIIVTKIEAYLILGQVENAKSLVMQALEHSHSNYEKLASTVRQLKKILELKCVENSDWLGPLTPPEVIHYAGHINIAGLLESNSEIHEAEELIDQELSKSKIVAAFGSLAAGADIMIAEKLIQKGVQLHVVLPFDKDDFFELCVKSKGMRWKDRFEFCLSNAKSVRFATEEKYLGDDSLFKYSEELAMGLAYLLSEHLYAPVRQIALVDESVKAKDYGTLFDTKVWKSAGFSQTIIPCRYVYNLDVSNSHNLPLLRKNSRSSRAMLFGDIKGFSKLLDHQIPIFSEFVMGAIAEVIDKFEVEVLFKNTWGDGIFLVFSSVGVAARFALELQARISSTNFKELDLPDDISLRIGGHLGPVYEVQDPILKKTNFLGSHVSRAARIEPVTPEGSIYVTETFAAVLSLYHSNEFRCDYVGLTDMAKNYGKLRMFALNLH